MKQGCLGWCYSKIDCKNCPDSQECRDKLYGKKKLIILVGPQGSGKTEYCKTIPNAFRVSQDEQGRLHKEIFEADIKRGEKLIVVDKTNPGTKQRRRYIKPAKEAGYYIQIVWFDIDREICLKRIINRTDHPTLKPEKAEEALSEYFSNFEEPSKEEADEIIKVR